MEKKAGVFALKACVIVASLLAYPSAQALLCENVFLSHQEVLLNDSDVVRQAATAEIFFKEIAAEFNSPIESTRNVIGNQQAQGRLFNADFSAFLGKSPESKIIRARQLVSQLLKEKQLTQLKILFLMQSHADVLPGKLAANPELKAQYDILLDHLIERQLVSTGLKGDGGTAYYLDLKQSELISDPSSLTALNYITSGKGARDSQHIEYVREISSQPKEIGKNIDSLRSILKIVRTAVSDLPGADPANLKFHFIRDTRGESSDGIVLKFQTGKALPESVITPYGTFRLSDGTKPWIENEQLISLNIDVRYKILNNLSLSEIHSPLFESKYTYLAVKAISKKEINSEDGDLKILPIFSNKEIGSILNERILSEQDFRTN